MTACSEHFAARVRDRIGDSVDAVHLAEGIIWAIQNARTDTVRFVCRTNRRGMRLFRFRAVPGGRYFYALVNTEAMVCVTVLPSGFQVGRQGKKPLELKDYQL